jgi:putative FmdB family regulatory protein
MPIYEYACPDCGHRFELIQKFSDEPASECPSCKAGNVKKLVSLSSFHLAGGGWYKDHYGLKQDTGTKEGGEPKGEPKPAGAESRPGAAESKPAPAESKPTPAESKPATPAPAAPSPK